MKRLNSVWHRDFVHVLHAVRLLVRIIAISEERQAQSLKLLLRYRDDYTWREGSAATDRRFPDITKVLPAQAINTHSTPQIIGPNAIAHARCAL
ncbi:hypothetical protein CFBP2533_33840 [Xanthomonas hortorum pv. pelargonii]|uniref:Uncharacterized protein n=1 Tax=Xanthomonas hortorum pv. pelargonii TaxID=453602 RepID=A0A6V7EBJ9_9XANT|nr:hypothetical protein CFBP2533_33840 [Xanthomonas hortorum pv. pelargonii]CAD0348535.1 hypothetical protein CFBP2533_33840 [Xanthomonas hortorum pv. pelargonii]